MKLNVVYIGLGQRDVTQRLQMSVSFNYIQEILFKLNSNSFKVTPVKKKNCYFYKDHTIAAYTMNFQSIKLYSQISNQSEFFVPRILNC